MFRLESSEYGCLKKKLPEKVYVTWTLAYLNIEQGTIFEGLKPEFRDSSISGLNQVLGLRTCNHYFNIANREVAESQLILHLPSPVHYL